MPAQAGRSGSEARTEDHHRRARTATASGFVDGSIDGFAQSDRGRHGGRTYSVRLPLVGAFQVQNALARRRASRSRPAASRQRVFAALEKLTGAKGRLELVGDAATARRSSSTMRHKPDALEKALEALRPYAQAASSSWCSARAATAITGKRPIMGAIAAENADRVIVTDDNPRSENPAAIRAAILAAPGADRDRRSRARRSATRSPSSRRRRAADRRQGP